MINQAENLGKHSKSGLKKRRLGCCCEVFESEIRLIRQRAFEITLNTGELFHVTAFLTLFQFQKSMTLSVRLKIEVVLDGTARVRWHQLPIQFGTTLLRFVFIFAIFQCLFLYEQKHPNTLSSLRRSYIFETHSSQF